MSRALCAKILPMEKMARWEAAFPNMNWDVMFAIINKHGTLAVEIGDAVAGCVDNADGPIDPGTEAPG